MQDPVPEVRLATKGQEERVVGGGGHHVREHLPVDAVIITGHVPEDRGDVP